MRACLSRFSLSSELRRRSGIVSAGVVALGAALSLAIPGCALDLGTSEGVDGIYNECTVDEECYEGSCQAGACVSFATELETVLLEITTPSSTPEAPGVRFRHVLSDIDRDPDQDIGLGFVSRVVGVVQGRAIDPSKCLVNTSSEAFDAPVDDSLPARVTWVPRERLLGLASPLHTVESDLSNGSYSLSASVPPGKYDIYVEPRPVLGGCERPPFLVLDRTIDSADVDFTVRLNEPELLTIVVRWPHAEDALSGFTLDLVERETGRVLSNRGLLHEPTKTDDGLEYQVQLVFTELEDPDRRVTEVVRLSPPVEAVAPVVYIERSVVELFQEDLGVVDQVTDLPAAVRVEGRLNRAGGSQAEPGAVTLVATELASLNPGTIASFSRVVTTDEEGVFSADLLPGKYAVLAEPDDPDLAQTRVEIVVTEGDQTQAGRVIEVSERKQIHGTVLAAPGVSVGDMQVLVRPLPGATNVNELDWARGLGSFWPRPSSSTTDDAGAFSVSADVGVFDVVIQPDASSGFAWSVRRSVELGSTDVELGTIELTSPFTVQGVLESADVGLLSGALIRAYAYLKDGVVVSDPTIATSVVPVGEARSNGRGEFRLLLPARVE